jgi:hypothetical protein
VSHITQLRNRFSPVFWTAVLLLGGFQFWISRQAMNTDGISYLDIADAMAHGQWAAAVNAYWSPLYPSLLALGRMVFRPSPYSEFAMVHFVNFLIFIAAAFAFEVFLNNLLNYIRQIATAETDASAGALPEWLLRALGYSLFLWSSLVLIGLGTVAPDMAASVFVFLAAAIVVRIKSGQRNTAEFILLGLFLGLSYLAKAAMMPLGFVILALAVMAACQRTDSSKSGEQASILSSLRWAVPKAALALAVLLVVAAPLIFALSKSKGRLTMGDSARLNWAWYINHVPRYHWQGVPAVGVPTHPTRKLLANPGVFEFDSDAPATYDIWYDPSYWNDGVRPRFDFKSQIGQLINNFRFYLRFIFVQQAGIVFPAILLLAIGWGRPLWKRLGQFREELLLGLAALVMYAPVYVEMRYFAPFLVILWLGLFAAVRFQDFERQRRIAFAAASIAFVFVVGSLFASITDAKGPAALRDAIRPRGFFLQYQVAEDLHSMGVEPGEKVAWIRPTKPMRQRYDWARLAKLKIIAEIPGGSEDAFWNASPDAQEQVIETLDSTGAKALVVTQPPVPGSKLDWKPIGSTGFSLVFLTPSRVTKNSNFVHDSAR